MPLFRSGPKTPQELVKSMKDALQILKAEQSGSKKGDKASELGAIHTHTFTLATVGCWRGSQAVVIHENDTIRNWGTRAADRDCRTTSTGNVQHRDVIPPGLQPSQVGIWSGHYLGIWFELHAIHQAKKDVAQIFNNVLRRQIGTRSPTVEHIQGSSEILFILVRG